MAPPKSKSKKDKAAAKKAAEQPKVAKSNQPAKDAKSSQPANNATNDQTSMEAQNHQTVYICGVCHTSDDKSSHMWILCDKCDKICHFECVGITEIDEDELWVCLECQELTQDVLLLNDTTVNEATNVSSNLNRTSTTDDQMPSPKRQSKHSSNSEQLQFKVPVTVHATQDSRIEDIVENANGESDIVLPRTLPVQQMLNSVPSTGNPGTVRGGDTIDIDRNRTTNTRPSMLPTSSTRIGSFIPTEQPKSFGSLHDRNNRVRAGISETQSNSARTLTQGQSKYQELLRNTVRSINNLNAMYSTRNGKPADKAHENSQIQREGHQSTIDIVNDQQSKATSVTSSKSTKSKVQSTSSKASSSVSSQRRRNVELLRIKEELDLQTKLDEEKAALEREAFDRKEKREKRFIEEKYKMILDNEGSSKSSSRASDQASESKASIVRSWIRDQSNRNLQSDRIGKIQQINFITSIFRYL